MNFKSLMYNLLLGINTLWELIKTKYYYFYVNNTFTRILIRDRQ